MGTQLPDLFVFALLAGLLIYLGSKRVKQLEAYIGLLYAFGISAVFILLSKSPHGMEAFHDLMAADILFTPLKESSTTAVFYSILGLFIFFVMRKNKGFIRDILFFTTFALTVTSSVKMAGVLTIFALLISPALIVRTSGARQAVLSAGESARSSTWRPCGSLISTTCPPAIPWFFCTPCWHLSSHWRKGTKRPNGT
jgi:ABC-type Mn2+/Zn2+ transport system permease subunit